MKISTKIIREKLDEEYLKFSKEFERHTFDNYTMCLCNREVKYRMRNTVDPVYRIDSLIRVFVHIDMYDQFGFIYDSITIIDTNFEKLNLFKIEEIAKEKLKYEIDYQTAKDIGFGITFTDTNLTK